MLSQAVPRAYLAAHASPPAAVVLGSSSRRVDKVGKKVACYYETRGVSVMKDGRPGEIGACFKRISRPKNTWDYDLKCYFCRQDERFKKNTTRNYYMAIMWLAIVLSGNDCNTSGSTRTLVGPGSNTRSKGPGPKASK